MKECTLHSNRGLKDAANGRDVDLSEKKERKI
jgi:hypothetical protein